MDIIFGKDVIRTFDTGFRWLPFSGSRSLKAIKTWAVLPASIAAASIAAASIAAAGNDAAAKQTFGVRCLDSIFRLP